MYEIKYVSKAASELATCWDKIYSFYHCMIDEEIQQYDVNRPMLLYKSLEDKSTKQAGFRYESGTSIKLYTKFLSPLIIW